MPPTLHDFWELGYSLHTMDFDLQTYLGHGELIKSTVYCSVMNNKLDTARMLLSLISVKSLELKRKACIIKCRVHHHLKPGSGRGKKPEENISI